MDLCLTREAARTPANCGASAILITLLLISGTVYGQSADSSRDYLFPSETRGGLIRSPSAIEASSSVSKPSATTQYQAFNGQFYDLVSNQGRYVNVLVPEAVESGPFFTADHLEEMIDRLDILYTIYADLLHGEPGGEGQLTIAFVPDTCGIGCGLVGGRGIEIKSEPQVYEDLIRELDAGRLDPVLLHEMAHNFDAWSAYFHYLPDHAHAWTDMFEFFAPYRYSRETARDQTPDELYNSPVSAVWKLYITDDLARWENCVRDEACGDRGLSANHLWAMLYYRIETLHGAEALVESFSYIREYSRTHAAPKTDLEKESLRILSLAAGAQTNIACYMDLLKWPLSDESRQEMQQQFGNDSSFCADQDNDGYAAINGDCDDNDPSRNINAIEIHENGVDDDCDGLEDEKNLVESEMGQSTDNFTGTVSITLPTEISGTSYNLNDYDTFAFTVPASERVRVTLCAQEEFNGWATGLNPDGSGLDSANWYIYRSAPGCASSTFHYSSSQQGKVAIMPNEMAGGFTLTLSAATALPPDPPRIQVTSHEQGGSVLSMQDDNGVLSSLGADEIEIWISGAAIRIFEPFSAGTELLLDRYNAPALRNGQNYQARIRPRAKGLPLMSFSHGQLFRHDNRGWTLPHLDHRFSGAWFDPQHEGEGFIVEVLDAGRALVYWFTYQADGRQRWLLGVGKIDKNQIEIDEMLDSRGGRFGNDFNPDEVVLKSAGSLTLSFNDCNSAQVNYHIDDRGDHQSLIRLSNVYGHGCGIDEQPQARDISGSWYDPSHDGEGFVIEQLSEHEALVFWFTYDDSGQQSWFYNTGTINGNEISLPELLQPVGGLFGRSFSPEQVIRNQWGSLTIELDCSGGKANYSSEAEGFSNGSQSLEPLTRLQNSGCMD